MNLYAGLDLHSRNTYIGIMDKEFKRIFNKRVANKLPLILNTLAPFQDQLKGIVVESTFNWYWLIDGLMDAGYQCVQNDGQVGFGVFFKLTQRMQFGKYFQAQQRGLIDEQQYFDFFLTHQCADFFFDHPQHHGFGVGFDVDVQFMYQLAVKFHDCPR